MIPRSKRKQVSRHFSIDTLAKPPGNHRYEIKTATAVDAFQGPVVQSIVSLI